MLQANQGCWAFNELLPSGFAPQFGGTVQDWSVAGGVRGELDFGLMWDFSAGVGQNSANFVLNNTVNASLGHATPREFNPGKYTQTDITVNLDGVMPVTLDALEGGLSLAGGLEYRHENFRVTSGDPASWQVGPYAQFDFSVGSNGFPGFSEDQAGSFSRQNVAAYVDVEADPTDQLRAGLAGRVEYFDSFGGTANVKASVRYSFFDGLALRASSGTGFRAPTPGQANVTNVSTVAGPMGRLVNVGTIPPTSPVAQKVGAQDLGPERSLNVGLSE